MKQPIRLAGLAAALGASISLLASGTAVASMSQSPGTMFRAASLPKVGKVLVDARGRTVYVLTANGRTNVACTAATGCTTVWPNLPLPHGTSAAKAGSGVQSSQLKTKKLSDGQTYPTYHGWLMYEFAGDSGPGQANGVGIKSFGGTWYALSASGKPITTSSSQSSGSGSSGGGGSSSGGYGY